MKKIAMMYRKPKNTHPQVSQPKQTNVNQFESMPDKGDDEESVNYITSYRELYKVVYDSNYDSDSENYVAAISSETANNIELNAKI